MKRKLTDKQKRFTEEYAIDSNATQSAIRAGFSRKTADEIGRQLLGKPWVKEELKKKQEKISKKLEITAELIARRINLQYKKSNMVQDRQHALKACELLGKHLGMFVDKQIISNPDGSGLFSKLSNEEAINAARIAIKEFEAQKK